MIYKEKNFNIIEIILLKTNDGRDLAHIGLLINKKRQTFICYREDFLNTFKDKVKIKKKTYIHCLEPAVILFTILSSKVKKSELKLKITSIKLEIYGFEFSLNETKIYIQNINRIASENTVKKINPNFKISAIINYGYELKYTLPEWAENWEALKIIEKIKFYNFYNSDKKNIEYSKKNILKTLEENINTLEKTLKLIDANLKIFLENWKFFLSISSISLKIFETRFNTYKIKLEEKEEEKLREALFGGRCEVLGNPYFENEDIFYYDFPSMYLNIMKESNFPLGSLIYSKNEKSIEKEGFYNCRVFSDLNLPILPFKIKEESENDWEEFQDVENRHTIYPNGEFTGIYYKKELEIFLEEGGRILEIIESWTFNGKNAPVFKEFAENVLEMRSAGEPNLWKSIGVSLYGRLGIKKKKTKTIITDNWEYKEDSKGASIISERWMYGFCFMEVEDNSNLEFKSNIGYAIIIAALGRIKLFKNIKSVLKEKFRVFYYDTDSIFIGHETSKKLTNKKIMDIEWDFSKKNIIDAVFANIRTYSILFQDGGWETKISGVERNSISFEDFKKNFYSLENSKISIPIWKKNIIHVDEWKEFNRINLKKYKKRSFSLDKKKTSTISIYKL